MGAASHGFRELSLSTFKMTSIELSVDSVITHYSSLSLSHKRAPALSELDFIVSTFSVGFMSSYHFHE